jgi:hypothetical protein
MKWPAFYDPASDIDAIMRNPGNVYIPYESFMQCCASSESTPTQQCLSSAMHEVTDATCLKLLHMHARIIENIHTQSDVLIIEPHVVSDVSLPYIESDRVHILSQPYAMYTVPYNNITCGMYLFRVTCLHMFKNHVPCTESASEQQDAAAHISKKRKVKPSPFSITELLQGLPKQPVKEVPAAENVQYVCCFLMDGRFFYMDTLLFKSHNYPAFFQCSIDFKQPSTTHDASGDASSVAAKFSESTDIILLDTCYISGRYCGCFARPHREALCRHFITYHQRQDQRRNDTTTLWTYGRNLIRANNSVQLGASCSLVWLNTMRENDEMVIHFSPCNRRYTSAFTGEQFKIQLNTLTWCFDAFIFYKPINEQQRTDTLCVAVPGRIVSSTCTSTAAAESAVVEPAAQKEEVMVVQTDQFFKLSAFPLRDSAVVCGTLHGRYCQHDIFDTNATADGVYARCTVATSIAKHHPPLLVRIQILNGSPLHPRAYYAKVVARLYCQIDSGYSYKYITEMIKHALHVKQCQNERPPKSDPNSIAHAPSNVKSHILTHSHWRPDILCADLMSLVLCNKYDGLSYKHIFLDPFMSDESSSTLISSSSSASTKTRAKWGSNLNFGDAVERHIDANERKEEPFDLEPNAPDVFEENDELERDSSVESDDGIQAEGGAL